MMNCTQRIALIAVIVLLAAVAGVAWSQEYGPAKAMTKRSVDLDCRNVLVELQTLGADMVEFDTQLVQMVEEMQRADESEQLAATQAVVEEMVTQRCLVIGRIKTSHQLMVHHFLTHLMIEPPDVRRAELESCPLMDYMQRPPVPSGSGFDPGQSLDR